MNGIARAKDTRWRLPKRLIPSTNRNWTLDSDNGIADTPTSSTCQRRRYTEVAYSEQNEFHVFLRNWELISVKFFAHQQQMEVKFCC